MKSTMKAIVLATTICAIPAAMAEPNQFTQEIHVVNLLANTDLPDPGMTPTAIIVDYYNGSSWPCWTNHLTYQQDVTIHAGPTQGCKAKVNRVVISPTLAADKIKTYVAPIYVEIDPRQYSTQIMVVQQTPPSFDTLTGLASTSGTATTRVQAQLAGLQ